MVWGVRCKCRLCGAYSLRCCVHLVREDWGKNRHKWVWRSPVQMIWAYLMVYYDSLWIRTSKRLTVIFASNFMVWCKYHKGASIKLASPFEPLWILRGLVFKYPDWPTLSQHCKLIHWFSAFDCDRNCSTNSSFSHSSVVYSARKKFLQTEGLVGGRNQEVWRRRFAVTRLICTQILRL